MNEERHQQVATMCGAPDCVRVIHQDFLKVYEGRFCEKVLLPKGWELNDYDPNGTSIEIENTKTGDRFWLNSEQFFCYNYIPGNQVLLIKNGAKNIKDAAFHLKMKLDRYDAVIERKRCYILAIYEPISVDQEAATA